MGTFKLFKCKVSFWKSDTCCQQKNLICIFGSIVSKITLHRTNKQTLKVLLFISCSTIVVMRMNEHNIIPTVYFECLVQENKCAKDFYLPSTDQTSVIIVSPFKITFNSIPRLIM